MSYKRFIPGIIILFILVIHLGLGLPRLSKYSAVDEPYWTYDRISQFWNSVRDHKWKSTRINDKPGITVAIISGPGLLFVDPMQYKNLRQKVKTPEQELIIQKINFFFRLPILLFSSALLLLFYFLLKKLFGTTTAIFSLIFIGLSPIILGISLIINPDSLLWLFLPLTLLSYFVYQKEHQKRYLYLSGIFLGLSLLTKYVSNILYVFLFGLIFFRYLFEEGNSPSSREYLKRSLIDYGKLLATSLVTFFILFPAAWVNIKILLEGTFLSEAFESTWPIFATFIGLILLDLFALKGIISDKVLHFLKKMRTLIIPAASLIFLTVIVLVFANVYSDMHWFNLEAVVASPKSPDQFQLDFNTGAEQTLANFYSLIFGISPLALIFFIVAVAASAIRMKKNSEFSSYAIASFVIFILLYYAASAVNGVIATVRYQIALYPLAFIMSALGLSHVISKISSKKKLLTAIAGVIIAVESIIGLFLVKPYYFAYSSPLLPNQYILNMKNMGDGSFEAAQHLNQLPDAQNMIIWSDKGAVCESFIGRCVVNFNRKDIENVDFDYFVASTDRRRRSLALYESSIFKKNIDFSKLYNANEFYEHKIVIGNRPNNFVKIVKGETLKK